MDNKSLPAFPVTRYDEMSMPFADKRDNGLTKLEAFTMAAMQGLCHNIAAGDLTTNEAVAVASSAVYIAKLTLSELQKQQS